MIFAAQRLGHFWIQECYKTECPERFWDENVGNFAKFGEIVFKIFSCDVFGATSNKHFARQVLNGSFL